jgi:hypothetical protein
VAPQPADEHVIRGADDGALAELEDHVGQLDAHEDRLPVTSPSPSRSSSNPRRAGRTSVAANGGIEDERLPTLAAASQLILQALHLGEGSEQRLLKDMRDVEPQGSDGPLEPLPPPQASEDLAHRELLRPSVCEPTRVPEPSAARAVDMLDRHDIRLV